MRNDKGFNMIELLVVIAICGILAGIAAPNLSNLVRKGRIENQTRRIYDDLSNVRIMAMSRNMMHFFRFAGNPYTVIADTNGDDTAEVPPIGGCPLPPDPSNPCTHDTRVLERGGPDLVPFTFSGAVPANESIEGTQVSFNARGLASQQGTVCIGDATVKTQPSVNCVVVNMTRIRMGKIKIQDIIDGNCDSEHCDAIR